MADIQFKVEKERVLVPVGIPCPFGCKYCYTRNGEVGPARVKPVEILNHLQEFAILHAFNTIQFGYDSDPFAFPERGIAMLERLIELGKHINFSTKACIEGAVLDALATVRRNLGSHLSLSALVSLSCWESAPAVEPHTPTPEERMRTVSNLKRIGIPTFIAVRPLLPHIADAEYEHVIDEALRAGCDRFILGPLYADEKERFVRFVPKEILRKTPGRKVVVPWSAHAPRWTRYEDGVRMQRIMMVVEAKGGKVFWSSADAVESVIYQVVSQVVSIERGS
jgi:DNA repair photolyase